MKSAITAKALTDTVHKRTTSGDRAQRPKVARQEGLRWASMHRYRPSEGAATADERFGGRFGQKLARPGQLLDLIGLSAGTDISGYGR
jgi:hypothetical protein